MDFKRRRQNQENTESKIHKVMGLGYAVTMTEMSELTPRGFPATEHRVVLFVQEEYFIMMKRQRNPKCVHT